MQTCIARSTWSLGNAKNRLKTEDALAGDGGWANEKTGRKTPDDNQRVGLRRGGAQLDQNDERRSGCDRRRRMHHDAKLAVVGVD
jgi:hypothetical protein